VGKITGFQQAVTVGEDYCGTFQARLVGNRFKHHIGIGGATLGDITGVATKTGRWCGNREDINVNNTCHNKTSEVTKNRQTDLSSLTSAVPAWVYFRCLTTG